MQDMSNMDINQAAIVNRINGLTPDMIQEVIDFIDFLKSKKIEKSPDARESLLLQQESLFRIWESDSEDLYDL
jgi:hypothetical protein